MKTQQMAKYVLGGLIAVDQTFFCASSNAQAKEKKMNEALTINGDGAQRNPDIHWLEGQHPEDADLYAHNDCGECELRSRVCEYRRCAVVDELVSQLPQCGL